MFLKISKFFLYVSLLSVVVVMTTTFFPFIGGKDYFFRFSVELALIFFILWWAFEDHNNSAWHKIKNVAQKPLFIAVSAFVLMVLLASFFAYDPHAAFWSNYERGEGSFQMIHYYAFFSLLVLLFEKKEEWRWFFKVFLAAAICMILYGLFADLGWASNFISQYQGGAGPCTAAANGVAPCSPFATVWHRLVDGRFQGSLGNPAYVAPYLMFSIFYALYLWATSRFAKHWLSWLLYGGLTFALFFFFMTSQTRGAFLGLGVAIFAAFVYSAFRIKRLRIWFGVIAAVFLLGGIIAVHYSNTPFVQSLPAGRLLQLSTSDSSAQTRFWTWGSAWKGFKERPILGWGPENFSTVFDKYFDPRHFIPGASTETWFDRAHSIYFDYLAETGILGLLSYLAIFLFFYVEFFKKHSHEQKHSAMERTLMFVLPVGYLVQGAAIFDVLPIYINVFAFFAFAYYFLYSPSGEHNKKQNG